MPLLSSDYAHFGLLAFLGSGKAFPSCRELKKIALTHKGLRDLEKLYPNKITLVKEGT